MTTKEQIRTTAESTVKEFGPISGLGSEFGYNRASVEWLDDYIERSRNTGCFSADQVEALANNFACFLGECIRHTYGGEWQLRNGSWGVFFPDSGGAFPYSKVRKQFDDGNAGGESVLGFFDILPRILSGELDRQNQTTLARIRATLRRWFGA